MNPLLFIGIVTATSLLSGAINVIHANPSRQVISEVEEGGRVLRLERELKKVSHDLVMAHRELAVRLEQIAQLEEELAKHSLRTYRASDEVAPTLVKVVGQERVPHAVRSSDEGGVSLSPGLGADSLGTAVAVSQKESSSRAMSYRISYNALSAVNYQARDEVVAWLETFQVSESDRIVIRAQANDTPHQLTNQEIADNRARYLAAYLRQHGVPAVCIITVEGQVSTAVGAKGREVTIEVERAEP